jgi:hypothetical protein
MISGIFISRKVAPIFSRVYPERTVINPAGPGGLFLPCSNTNLRFRVGIHAKMRTAIVAKFYQEGYLWQETN